MQFTEKRYIFYVFEKTISMFLSWFNEPQIILHPQNRIWNPAKLLNRKTSFRFGYRSLKKIEAHKSKQVKVLIPISDCFAAHLSENSKKIRKNNYVFLSCSSSTALQALSNKAQLALHPMQQHLPKTYTLTDVCYPCFLKYSEGYASNRVFKIENEEELHEKKRNMILNKEYILQEAIFASREYSTLFLVNDGKIVFQCGSYDEYCSDLFIWPRDKSVATVNFLLDPNGNEIEVFEQFFKGYTGLINCNYKLSDGDLKILEFNPRLSADIYNFSKADLEQLIKAYRELAT